MPRISKRGEELPASPIRRLSPLADEAKSRGIKIYHLNIGQPDIATPQSGLDVLKHIDRTILEYSPSNGLPSLRKKFTEYYGRYGIVLSPDEIIVTTGGSEAIQLAFMSSMDAGDEIIMTDPGYANYISFAESAGVKVRPIPTSIDNGFSLPAIEEFERYLSPRTKAIMLCNPNNPTGYIYSREEMYRIRDFVKRHDLFLISDEVYREFCYTSEPYVSAMELTGIEQNVILVDSVSKRYSECGIRIGTLVTHNKDIRSAAMKAAQARLSPPLLGQLVAEASIDAPQSYLDAVYEEYLERRNVLLEGLNKIPGVYAPIPGGAFYTMAHLPVDDSDKFCEWMLRDFSVDGETVMFAPGSGFYTAPSLGRQQVRIAYILKKADIVRSLEILGKALAVYPGRTE